MLLSKTLRRFCIAMVVLPFILFPSLCLADAVYDFIQEGTGDLLATMYLSGDDTQ